MIELNNLSFGYGKEKLFSGLNLSVDPGNICGLLGKNGAGKTTLLKILSGLLFEKNGTNSMSGFRPGNREQNFLKELIFLPEEFLLPSVTIKKYEKLYSPFYPRFDHTHFSNYLEEFNLESGKNLMKCSYGQKKKLLLAFAIASNSKLMLLDEPTNGLDIPSKSQFRKALASAITDERLIVISTHQARDLESLIDPVIILDQGQVIFNQPIAEITDNLTVKHFIDEPEANQVLYMEKTMGGYNAIVQSNDNNKNRLDLEMLFNAVITNPKKMSLLFEQGGEK